MGLNADCPCPLGAFRFSTCLCVCEIYNIKTTTKHKYVDSKKLLELKSKMVVVKDRGAGNREMLVKGYTFLVIK